MNNQTLWSYWSVSDTLVLFTTVACGAALCLSGRALRPRLVFLPILGLYEAVMGITLFLIALQPVPNTNYWLGYWYSSIGENVLLCLVAIELTCALLPRKQLAAAWCAALAVLLVLSVGTSMPARTELKLMNATLAGDFVAGLVLIALLYSPVAIPKAYRFVIAGVLVPATIHALATFRWLHGDLNRFAAAMMPFSSLAGLALLIAGSWMASRAGIKNGADESAPGYPIDEGKTGISLLTSAIQSEQVQSEQAARYQHCHSVHAYYA